MTLNAVIAAICSQVKGRGTAGAVCDPSCKEHDDGEPDHVGNNVRFGKLHYFFGSLGILLFLIQ